MKTFRQITALSLMISSMLFITPATASTPVQKDSPVINTLFAQTKPQCIGRYVIDVPGSFNNQLHDMIFIDDFKIESKLLYPPAFKQRVQLREQELRNAINKPGNRAENAPFLKEIVLLPDGKGAIFDHNESGTPDIYRQLEAHVYSGMTAFVITTDIRDFSDKKHSEKKMKYLARGFTEADANTKPAKLAAMQSLISRLSGRKDEDIPSAKGVCIPNGFIRDDGSQHVEKITFSYKNDDFILGVYTNNKYPGSEDTLFNRSAQINEALKTSNQYTIKKVALSPNGIPAESWLSGVTPSVSVTVPKTSAPAWMVGCPVAASRDTKRMLSPGSSAAKPGLCVVRIT
ncbi:T6SS immunity protein Tli4 family protein [Citrobacter braakii]|uniref:T6SS immunity protein Tli4 family protein n=1 Tax=Citrobacter braakii TaxID=57706 RepID=UPI002DB570E5|nr:T6SS immunity protein Tli4 family protein [Citrobacter braakii]MEB8220211.1 T6SS immunity protein Tli4 family protein [Citrobacter braakii]MEB8303074.1 T6SS immunity protein Tli4 family protein [Citrobacter braakii]